MSSLLLEVSGLAKFKETLKGLGGRARKTVSASLYGMAQNIMTDSKKNYVPVEHTVLASSGQVAKPELHANEISVVMGFGGNAKQYALAVHEHLSEHSPRTWKIAETRGGVKFRVGGPKYLELPFLAATTGGKLEEKLGADIRAEWESQRGL